MRSSQGRQARADLQQEQQQLLLQQQQQQQQLQWWSSPQRHDKRVQLFALKIFTHDSVARPGQSQIQSRSQAGLPQQESPHALLCPGSHVCICCTGTQITARLGVRSTGRARARAGTASKSVAASASSEGSALLLFYQMQYLLTNKLAFHKLP